MSVNLRKENDNVLKSACIDKVEPVKGVFQYVVILRNYDFVFECNIRTCTHSAYFQTVKFE